MRAYFNDSLRAAASWTILYLGLLACGWQRFQLLAFSVNQRRLKRKYGITDDTPVLTYGPEVAQSIRAKADKGAKFGTTSGTTGKPKELLYTKRRLLALKLAFSAMFAGACYSFRLKRTSLYVFSSFEADTSLTSLLLDESALPHYLSTLQAPYRVQHHPAIQALVSKYGATAVRLWILTISNPGVLYSTNPSTISTFLDELARDWQRSSELIRDWCYAPASFASEVHNIACRLASRGCAKRLKQIANSDQPLPLSQCTPAVRAYICWTGGYVKPFLDRLATHLPSPRYELIPMYSMSTETIETLPYFRDREAAFLPLAPGVVYEFMDDAENLLDAHQLEPGKLYAMVVSDTYGLRRYQTADLFLCKRKIHELPDLSFVRRRSLEYSFTGEKLTAEQLSIVFEQLRASYSSLLADRFLTCVPSQPPHYKVLLVGDSSTPNSHDFLAARCDQLLCEINCEYRSKRVSGRLGPVEVVSTKFNEFVAMNGNWETQFKFLPLIMSSF
ncbi:MAG TPA: GH3 auxin-responsive promoter family protein [Pyrinomonadaceae bacterium]|nr:GH3 auxin-responsive promoter family protein [Pyrinomonadaceae bacterium]